MVALDKMKETRDNSMKKAFTMILLPVICFFLGVTSITIDLNKPVVRREIMGYLYDDKGNCFEVEGRPIETFTELKRAYGDEADITVTYLYAIDGSIFYNTPNGSRPGSFLKLYLVNTYVQDGKFNLLTSVSGNWEVKDSGTTVEKASLDYGCRGSGAMEQYGKVSVDNHFVVETGFTDPIFVAAGSAGASLTLELLVDGTDTWTFTAKNQLEYPTKIVW